MPVLVLLTGGAVTTWLEYRLQVTDLHKTLLIFFGMGVITSTAWIVTTQMFWGWNWK